MATPAQWLAGARPRTLPAAVSPVLAGHRRRGVTHDAVWWKALLALVRGAGAAGRRQLRQRLLRRHPRHRRRPGRPDAAGRLRRGHARRGEARGVRGVRRRRRRSAWCWRRPPPGGWWRSARSCIAGRLVLHRRLAALRLPRPRRGDGLRLLRPGRRGRHDVRPDRDVRRWPALYAAVGIGALACAILVANNLRDIPTDREVGKRTLAVRARRRAHPRPLRPAGRTRPGRAGRAGARPPPWAALGALGLLVAARAARVVLGGAQGRELVPVLQQTGLAELAYGAGILVGLLVAAG